MVHTSSSSGTQLPVRRRRIYYDVSELAIRDKGTGIQRVTKALLNVLVKMCPPNWEVLPVVGNSLTGKFNALPILPKGGLGLSQEDQLKEIRPTVGDLFLSVDLAYNITEALESTLLKMRSDGVVICFVVHDIIPLQYPEWFEGTAAWFEGDDYLSRFQNWFRCATAVSSSLICVSQTVASTLEDWFEVHHKEQNRPPVSYFRLGCDISSANPSKGYSARAVNFKETIDNTEIFLMVGTIEPRKGHSLVLDAFEQLWGAGVDSKLIFIGKAGWRVDKLVERISSHSQRGVNFEWLVDVSDEVLLEYYQLATCLLAMSTAEGFGLPLVEAASYSVPLFVRDIPVFREVCGEGAYYFQGESANDLRCELERFCETTLASRREKVKNVPNITWKQSARRLLNAIQDTGAEVNDWLR